MNRFIIRTAPLFLWLGSLILAAFAVAFLVSPRWIGKEVSLDLSSPTAATDVRAVYGGFELGVALFLAWCAVRRERLAVGLVAGFLGSAGFAGGRALGMLLDGSVAPVHAQMFAFEVFSAVLAALALRALAKENPATHRATSAPVGNFPQ